MVGYLAGSEVGTVPVVPEALDLLEIKEATYAVFACNTATVGETWPYIHSIWLPNSTGYAMANSPVFEFYPPGYGETTEAIQIHVALRKKG